MVYKVSYVLNGQGNPITIEAISVMDKVPDNIRYNEKYKIEVDGFQYEDGKRQNYDWVCYLSKEYIARDTRHRDQTAMSEILKKEIKKRLLGKYLENLN